MSDMKVTIGEDKKTLILERTFPAARSKVWAAFTKPELFVKWWGPRGFETTVKAFEFKDGGTVHYGMKCTDPAQKDWYGQTSWGKMTFSDINPENSYVYEDVFADENGVTTPDMPVTTVLQEFTEADGSTRLVSTGTYASAEALKQVLGMGMEQGIKETWDRLEEFVSQQ